MGILLTMAEDIKKKSKVKTLLKRFLKFGKKDDKIESVQETETKEVKPKAIKIVSPAAKFLERIEELEKEVKQKEETKKISIQEIEEDERQNERLDSQSSQDSGFSEKDYENHNDKDVTDIFENLKIEDESKNNKHTSEDIKKFRKESNRIKVSKTEIKNKESDLCDDVIEDLSKLKIDEAKDKKVKKIRTLAISRGPVIDKDVSSRAQAHPYVKTPSQIKVNKQTFSGGRVIEAPGDRVTEVDKFQVIVDEALKDLYSSSKKHDQELDEDEQLTIVDELIHDECLNPIVQYQYQSLDISYQNLGQEQFQIISPYDEIVGHADNILDEFGISQPVPEILNTTNFQNSSETTGPFFSYPATDIMNCPEEFTSFIQPEEHSVYMTPPRSVNIASPLSDFHSSPRTNTSNSDYTFSPSDRSSPVFNPDLETYQKIPQFDSQSPPRSEIETVEKKTNLKQFKSMQNEIAASFASKECCQKNRRSCKEIFEEKLAKFKPEQRRNICLNVCKLDLNSAWGVLQKILLNLSSGSDKEDLEYSIFGLVCQKVLSENPSAFLGEFGLTLLELSVLRCYSHPTLTRHLVECVRAVKRHQQDNNDCIFQRVDSKGDNLMTACARGGDKFGDVLYWLVRRETHEAPLFDLGHVNTEGYSALHVACKAHSTRGSRLHVTHVLLEHGLVDLKKGDLKGGDTALHLAVSSSTCDLRLVLLLFRHVDRTQWKQFAHCNNKGLVTPIEYARCAAKSSAKQNFPTEVLEFMRKLR